MSNEPLHLAGLNLAELAELVEKFGEPKFRADQLFRGIQQRRLESLHEMTDIPKSLREELSDTAVLRTLTLKNRYESRDGTKRYLFETSAGNPVETVFIPTERRDTICFSSQSGCALKCDFCLTAKLGFLQNLTPGEIVEQIIYVLNDVYGVAAETPHGTNLVAMGAGEPFHNFDNLVSALLIMHEKNGLHIVPDRITVSTAGVVPKIREFAKLERRPHLAISLSAPNDELRDRLMPINKKWNIEQLLKAAREFEKTLRRGERLTFEYVLLEGVNDQANHAKELAHVIKRSGLTRVKVNLIPHNTADALEFCPPAEKTVSRFKSILETEGISAYVRTPRGEDIFAACGQLAANEVIGVAG